MVVTQSVVLERSLKIEGKEGKALLNLFFYHNHIVEVGLIHLLCSLCSGFSCCFMLGPCSCYFGFHLNACMYVGYAWKGLNHVFLNVFLLVLFEFLKRFLWVVLALLTLG